MFNNQDPEAQAFNLRDVPTSTEDSKVPAFETPLDAMNFIASKVNKYDYRLAGNAARIAVGQLIVEEADILRLRKWITRNLESRGNRYVNSGAPGMAYNVVTDANRWGLLAPQDAADLHNCFSDGDPLTPDYFRDLREKGYDYFDPEATRDGTRRIQVMFTEDELADLQPDSDSLDEDDYDAQLEGDSFELVSDDDLLAGDE
jgi:hypothetical protein